MDHSGFIDLCRSNDSKLVAAGISVGATEPGMVQYIEGLAAQLSLPPFGYFEVLVDSDVHLIGSTQPHIGPACGIGAYEVGEVGIDAVFGGCRNAVASGEVLHAGPGGPLGDVVSRAGEFEEVRGIKPRGEAGVFAVQHRPVAVEEGIEAEDNGRAGLKGVLPSHFPSTDEGIKSARHLSEQFPITSNGQLVDGGDGKFVGGILASDLVLLHAGKLRAEERSNLNQLGIGIRGDEAVAVGKTPLQLGFERIVIGPTLGIVVHALAAQKLQRPQQVVYADLVAGPATAANAGRWQRVYLARYTVGAQALKGIGDASSKKVVSQMIWPNVYTPWTKLWLSGCVKDRRVIGKPVEQANIVLLKTSRR